MIREGLSDSHAHLHGEEFEKDREDVLRRAREAGLELIVEVGSGEGMEDALSAIGLAEAYPFVYATLAIHPHDASRAGEELFERTGALLDHPKVVGVGETGLDYHYLNSPKEVQKEVFRRFISMARERRLPLVLHIRDAHRDALEILEEERASEVGGVAHCFSGGYEEARRLMDMGFYISFSGVVTFKNARRVREVVRKVPIERTLIETDAPYLSPEPFRGRRNEPAYVEYVARAIAEEKGLSPEDVARITTLNTRQVFRIGEGQREARIAYPIRDSLYLNITNRCTNYCIFCAKFNGYMVKGHYLKLEREPTVEEIIASLKGCERYREVVFCGFGEPLLRLDVVKEVAKWLKERGMRVRVDTDGLANLVYGRNVLPELEGLVDAISVSLNAPDEETYSRYCVSKYGREAYRAVKGFIKEAKRYIPEVTATVVALPDLDIEACRKVAEELGVRLRVREYNVVG